MHARPLQVQSTPSGDTMNDVLAQLRFCRYTVTSESGANLCGNGIDDDCDGLVGVAILAVARTWCERASTQTCLHLGEPCFRPCLNSCDYTT